MSGNIAPSPVPAAYAPLDRLPFLRRLVDYGLLLAGLAGAGYASWTLHRESMRDSLATWPWWLLLAGAFLAGSALLRMEAWLPDGAPPARPAAFPSVRRRALGLFLLLPALSLTAWVVVRLWPDYHRWQGTPLPWALALLLTLAGGWLLGAVGQPASPYGPQLSRSPDPPPSLPRWLEIGAFLAILALAVFLRLHRLDSIPAGIYVDETNASLDALYILEGRPDSPFGTGWYETPNGYIYYMAALYKLFGASYYTLKAASLIPALLTIPAIFFLGRLLFGPLTGLFAMFLLSVSRWHMTMSRWGWNELMPPLFQVLATFFLVRGLRERRALDYTLGGLLTGLVIYTYLSSRLVVATLGLFVLVWLLTDRDGPWTSWKRHWRGLVLYGAAALIAVAPIGVTYITNPFTFVNRAAEINIFNEVKAEGSLRPLRENVWRHVQLFYQKGDPTGRQNLPGEPQTDPVTGLLLAAGLAYGLLRWRDRRRSLLWIWLVLAMAGGYLSELRIDSPNSYRTLTAVPAVVLLAGDVLDRLTRGLLRLAPEGSSLARPRFSLVTAGALAVALLGLAAQWEIDTFFNRQAPAPGVKASFNLMETQVGQEVVQALEEGATVYLSHRFYNFSPLRFLVYGAMRDKMAANPLEEPPFHLARPEVDLPVPATGGDALFLLDTYYQAVTPWIRHFYPNARVEVVESFDGAPLYLRVRVSEAELRAIQGLEMQVRTQDGQGQRVVAQIERPAEAGVQEVIWQGGLRVERSGVYDLRLLQPLGNSPLPVEGAQIWVDEALWTGSRFLGRGLHELRVQAEGPLPQPGIRLFWQPPEDAFQPVPAAAFFQVEPPEQGLLGVYFRGENWSGEPVFSQVTPFLLLAWPPDEPFLHPFSARFQGLLRIDEPGRYHFRIDADDGARLTLDGQILGEGLVPDQPNQIQVDVELAAGEHPLVIDYFQRGGGSALEFFWRPPGRAESPVPPDALIPLRPLTE